MSARPEAPHALALFATAAVLLAGCGQERPGAQARPTVEVAAVTLALQPIQQVVELPGRVQAVRTAEVRARVDGIVQRQLYREGTDVRQGTALFAIDPREMRARQARAQAALQRAQATLANARQVLARYTGLVERRAISEQEFDAAQAAVRQGEADVAAARAELAEAGLNLSYTDVRAPISGRVGRAEVSEGALVSAAQATLLTRVEQLDPVHVRLSLPSAEILELRRRAAAGEIPLPRVDRVEVTLVLEDGSAYRRPGHLNFLDMAVDPTTGGQFLRAEFPNPERLLLPGQFVRARLEGGELANGLAVPQRAVQMSGEATTVMVVGADGAVSARPIQVGEMVHGQFVVRSGLRPGERVVVDGLQKVQPGQKVRVVPPSPPNPAPAAAAR
jgi:membrane fusion protein (multidrug efflux system)